MYYCRSLVHRQQFYNSVRGSKEEQVVHLLHFTKQTCSILTKYKCRNVCFSSLHEQSGWDSFSLMTLIMKHKVWQVAKLACVLLAVCSQLPAPRLLFPAFRYFLQCLIYWRKCWKCCFIIIFIILLNHWSVQQLWLHVQHVSCDCFTLSPHLTSWIHLMLSSRCLTCFYCFLWITHTCEGILNTSRVYVCLGSI